MNRMRNRQCLLGVLLQLTRVVLLTAASALSSSTFNDHDFLGSSLHNQRSLQETTTTLVQDENALVYDIGNIRPEGIRILPKEASQKLGLPGMYALVTELLFGGVKAVNLEMGWNLPMIPSLGANQRVGISVHYGNGYILITGGGPAGGFPASLQVFDATTGQLIISCKPPNNQGLFLMDVEIVNNVAYVTDTFSSMLWSVDLTTVTSKVCNMVGIPLPEEWFNPPTPETFMANGKPRLDVL